MINGSDSIVLSLAQPQIDSSRDAWPFFQKVHQLNRLNIEQLHLPDFVVRAGAWILVAIALRILWVFLRPVVGPYLGLSPTLRSRRIQTTAASGGGFSVPNKRTVKAKSGGGTALPGVPRMDRSGLKVTKRPKPSRDHGPSLPRW